MKAKEEFNQLVKQKVRQAALVDLLETKNKQSKMNNLENSELKTQSYLTNSKISQQPAKNIFKYRVRIANVRCNFRSQYEQNVKWPECEENVNITVVPEDTQEHLLAHCGCGCDGSCENQYMKLFDGDDEEKAAVVIKMEAVIQEREKKKLLQ